MDAAKAHPNEVAKLLQLVNQTKKPLNEIAVTFERDVKQPRQFSVACAGALMLEHHDLLPSVPQRMNVIYILYYLYREYPLSSNPFLAVFNAILQAPPQRMAEGGLGEAPFSLSNCERHFVIQLVTNPPAELSQQSTDTYVDAFAASQPRAKMPDLSSHLKSQECNPRVKSISALLPRPDTCVDSSLQTMDEKTTIEVASHKSFHDFRMRAPWCSADPPLMPCGSNELIWLNPDHSQDQHITWDITMAVDDTQAVHARALLQRAFRDPLPDVQKDELLTRLKSDNKLVFHIGLTPERLPDLVENNPLVAIDMILLLMPSARIGEYFSALVNMPMSLHCMEVVNRLTTAIDLPQEFIQLYISNCIRSCENVEDKYTQGRLVRLVCVFLQSLIRNNIINVQDLYVELQAFCMEFSKIREATGLFRLLQTTVGEDVPDKN